MKSLLAHEVPSVYARRVMLFKINLRCFKFNVIRRVYLAIEKDGCLLSNVQMTVDGEHIQVQCAPECGWYGIVGEFVADTVQASCTLDYLNLFTSQFCADVADLILQYASEFLPTCFVDLES
jgi:hypothetical protein